jgi:hypothetical protein
MTFSSQSSVVFLKKNSKVGFPKITSELFFEKNLWNLFSKKNFGTLRIFLKNVRKFREQHYIKGGSSRLCIFWAPLCGDWAQMSLAQHMMNTFPIPQKLYFTLKNSVNVNRNFFTQNLQ